MPMQMQSSTTAGTWLSDKEAKIFDGIKTLTKSNGGGSSVEAELKKDPAFHLGNVWLSAVTVNSVNDQIVSKINPPTTARRRLSWIVKRPRFATSETMMYGSTVILNKPMNMQLLGDAQPHTGGERRGGGRGFGGERREGGRNFSGERREGGRGDGRRFSGERREGRAPRRDDSTGRRRFGGDA